MRLFTRFVANASSSMPCDDPLQRERQRGLERGIQTESDTPPDKAECKTNFVPNRERLVHLRKFCSVEPFTATTLGGEEGVRTLGSHRMSESCRTRDPPPRRSGPVGIEVRVLSHSGARDVRVRPLMLVSGLALAHLLGDQVWVKCTCRSSCRSRVPLPGARVVLVPVSPRISTS